MLVQFLIQILNRICFFRISIRIKVYMCSNLHCYLTAVSGIFVSNFRQYHMHDTLFFRFPISVPDISFASFTRLTPILFNVPHYHIISLCQTFVFLFYPYFIILSPSFICVVTAKIDCIMCA